MIQLSKVTFFYCADNDRLALNGLTTEANTVRLWLTHRLLSRLVPTLVASFDKMQVVEQPSSTSTGQDIAHETKPVSVSEHELSREILVTSVDLKTANHHLALTFNDKGRLSPMTLCLAKPDIGRFMMAMEECSRLAGWESIPRHLTQSAKAQENDKSPITVH